MKRKMFIKTMFLAMILTLLLPMTLSCSAKNVEASELTFSGYIMDTHCFLKKPDPSLDTKKCLQMTGCAATGYGIAVKQSQNTYKFYAFDGKFAPEASDGQLLAVKLVDATTRTDHIYITVSGTLSDKNIRANDGTLFQVIDVTSLRESDE